MPLPTDSSIHMNSNAIYTACQTAGWGEVWRTGNLASAWESFRKRWRGNTHRSHFFPYLLLLRVHPCYSSTWKAQVLKDLVMTLKKYLCYRSLCTAMSPIVSQKTSQSHQASGKRHPKSQPKNFPIQKGFRFGTGELPLKCYLERAFLKHKLWILFASVIKNASLQPPRLFSRCSMILTRGVSLFRS